MSATEQFQQDLLEQARALVAALENGDVEGTEAALARIGALRESDIFQELGRMTRELHDALKEVELDESVHGLAQVDIPDARARLNHVIEMTDEAANKTLSLIEEAMPICEGLEEALGRIGEGWRRFRKREMSVEEFRELSREVEAFIEQGEREIAQLKAHLNEILMAQGFQDLTGQIIRKVIGIVDDLEDNLVGLIKKIHGDLAPARKKEDELAGPQIPGRESDTAVKGQDEVDELLASLGF